MSRTIGWEYVGDTFTLTEEWERDGLPNCKITFEATRSEVNAVLREVGEGGISAAQLCQSIRANREPNAA